MTIEFYIIHISWFSKTLEFLEPLVLLLIPVLES